MFGVQNTHTTSYYPITTGWWNISIPRLKSLSVLFLILIFGPSFSPLFWHRFGTSKLSVGTRQLTECRSCVLRQGDSGHSLLTCHRCFLATSLFLLQYLVDISTWIYVFGKNDVIKGPVTPLYAGSFRVFENIHYGHPRKKTFSETFMSLADTPIISQTLPSSNPTSTSSTQQNTKYINASPPT